MTPSSTLIILKMQHFLTGADIHIDSTRIFQILIHPDLVNAVTSDRDQQSILIIVHSCHSLISREINLRV
jgi:hypothetical protein